MENKKITIYEGDLDLVRQIVEYSMASLNEYDKGHRSALFFAAMSGNLDVFKYLTERCGLDPLEGDENLITTWDIVHEHNNEKGYCEIEKYLEDRYGHVYEDYYKNPIRSGFFPDPSICRVGDDYYMVNSSFIFFPCIPISHSRDLIHWEIIGHAITNPKWAYLSELEGGRGYWAPDITYVDGRFYIAATYRLNDVPPVYRRQMVVYSEKPEGPYSEPAFIDEDGIDPGLFFENGKKYMLLNRGARIFELDETGTKKVSPATLLYYGSNKRAPEGPHIYKKDGYYYLLQAEGGTGLSHRVTVARSRELYGVYEPCPYNPIMRQKDKDATIQRCGHGDMVETADGRWYMVYLCGRQIGDGFSILGRETAIDPVEWTPDGWPIVNNLKGPSCMQVKPVLNISNKPYYKEKTISPCGLPLDYMTPREFNIGDIIYEGGEKDTFTIKGSMYPLSSINSRNIVLRRQTCFSFSFKASIKVPNLSESQSLGITGYYDENTFFEFGIKCLNGKNYIYSNEHIGDEDRTVLSAVDIPKNTENITFCMETDRLKRTLSYKSDESELTIFNTLSNVYYLCDEGYHKGKRFTGAMVGMYAYAGMDDPLTAKFFDVCYTNLL